MGSIPVNLLSLCFSLPDSSIPFLLFTLQVSPVPGFLSLYSFFPWPLSPLQFLPLPPVDSAISILALGEGELRHAYPQVPSSSHPALPCAWGSFPKLLTPPQPQTNRASSLSLLKWLINGCSLWEADVLELLA